ncbi:hypothetical protein [Actinomadura gamaensis]|uniref:Uncharacterized protein n=1 Tax=Actinomadura gamaensis TaxID=1763541 RepID=A0ABV9U1Y6_9ACTN
MFYMTAPVLDQGQGRPSRHFNDSKRSEGKMHTQALIALARRLVDVI